MVPDSGHTTLAVKVDPSVTAPEAEPGAASASPTTIAIRISNFVLRIPRSSGVRGDLTPAAVRPQPPDVSAGTLKLPRVGGVWTSGADQPCVYSFQGRAPFLV